MTAWQRGRITQREEKGFGSVSFRRLLIAAGAGGLAGMVFGRAGGFLLAVMGGGGVFTVLLMLTAPVEGMTAGARLLRALHGRLLAAFGRGDWQPPESVMSFLAIDSEAAFMDFAAEPLSDADPEYALACTYQEMMGDSHA